MLCKHMLVLLAALATCGCAPHPHSDALVTSYLSIVQQRDPEAEKAFLQRQTHYAPLCTALLQTSGHPTATLDHLHLLFSCWMQKNKEDCFTFLQENYAEQGSIDANLMVEILGWFYEEQGTQALSYLTALPLSQSGWRACCLRHMMTYLCYQHPQQALVWAVTDDAHRSLKLHQWIQTAEPSILPQLAPHLAMLAQRASFQDTDVLRTFLVAYIQMHGDKAIQWFLTDFPEGPLKHQCMPEFIRYAASYNPQFMLGVCNNQTFIEKDLSHEAAGTQASRYNDLLAAFVYGAAQSAHPELASASLPVIQDSSQKFALSHWVYSCLERSYPDYAWQSPTPDLVLHRYAVSVPASNEPWTASPPAFRVYTDEQVYLSTHTESDWVVNIETPKAVDIHIQTTGVACQSGYFERKPFPVSSCSPDAVLSFRVEPKNNYYLKFDKGQSLLISVF